MEKNLPKSVARGKAKDEGHLLLSGYSPDITITDLHLGQGIHFLAKPFDTIALAKTVSGGLGRAWLAGESTFFRW